MTHRPPHRALALSLMTATALAVVTPAIAQEDVADFYANNDLTIVVGSGAGGGYDTYTRVLARHIGRHIPGEPEVIVQNMPGAGSMTAASHLLATAPQDGSVFASLHNTLLVEPLIRPESTPVDLTELVWVGSMGKHQNICVSWADGDIESLDDVMSGEITVAATGATTNGAIYPEVLNEVIGTQFQVISGYATGEDRLALERGEVDGVCGLSYQTLMTSNPDWITENRVNVLAQIGMESHPDLDAPLLADMIENEDDRRLMEVFTIQQELGRPYAAAPGVPQDRLEALRDAFQATMEDPEFLAEAEATNLMIEPIDGARMSELVGQLYSTPEAVVARVEDLLAE